MALNSTSVIKIVDLLCEGPIAGLVGAEQAIYLEETPIATGGARNFSAEDINYDFRTGGRTQTQLAQGRNGTSTITEIGVEIGDNYTETLNAANEVIARDYGSGQAIRQITDPDVDSFELLFSIPRLFSTAQEGLAKGQAFNGTIRVVVDVQSRGSAYVTQYDRTITGIAISDYQFKTPRINLTGSAPWNIRVRKIDLGENHFEIKYRNFTDVAQNIPLANNRGNRLFWTSLIEVQSLRSAYPYSAVAGLSISTRQFNSLPTRAYKIRGRIVQIPRNASVRADGSLEFNGAFTGALREAWTTCPVCCFYDMLINSRYGAGDFITAANVSWVDLYPLAQYANQLVLTPGGGREPRFACNIVIGDQAEAFNVLQDLASIFRGMLYWQANTIQATADHGNLNGSALSSVHLYTNSNVINGSFNYSGTSLKTRSSSIRVRYNDPQNFYKSNYVVVEDAALITKYGYQVKEIVAFGATSKYQAQRLGRWMLASEEIDGEVVNFTTGLQGAVVLPGQIFAVADQMRQGVRLAGRISSATTTAIVADQTIALPPGTGHQLTCTLSDGDVETRSISSVSGSTINVSAFSSAPLAQSVWSISSSSVKEQKFRCLSVSDNGDGQYTITGVQHNDSIYAAADLGRDLQFDDVTLFNDPPAIPIGLRLESREIRINQNTVNRVIASWSRGLNGVTFGYEVRYKIGGGNYRTASTTNVNYEIDNLAPGTSLTFEVRSVGTPPVNRKSRWVTTTFIVPVPELVPDEPTKVILPPDPSDVTIQATGADQALLRWKIPPTPLNQDRFVAIIRHSSKTDGTGEWANSTLLGQVSARTLYALLPLIEGEYLIKFQDENRQRSVNARSAVIDLPNPIPRLNIQVRREDQDTPPFQGQADGCFYSGEYDGLVLDGDETFDSVPDVDSLSSFDFVGTRLAAGRYYFASVLDLGGVFSVVFERTLTTRGLYPQENIDERNELIDRWTDFDGTLADDTSGDLYFRTSNQATTDEELLLEDGDFLLLEDGDKIQMESDIDFSEWTPMESGRYTGRQFQFKVELSSLSTDQTPIVDELGYVMQLESRTESSDVIASGAGAKAVTYTNAFYQTPSLGITASDLATGDYYRITSTSRSGFTITFYNSSNVAVDRNFQYQAVGYGTEEP